MNYLYYIGYAYTVYVAKQNPVKGFGETNIIRDHELTTADIVELQQSLGKNLIVITIFRPFALTSGPLLSRRRRMLC